MSYSQSSGDVVKKAVLLEKDLPLINTQTQGYSVRYRIVSEDKNRASHYSPIYNLKPNYELVTPGFLLVEKNASHLLLIWNPVTLKKNNVVVKKATSYNVWVRWHSNDDSGDWALLERVEATSLTVIPPLTYTVGDVVQPSAPDLVDVEIYLEGTPSVRFDEPNAFLKAYSKYDTAI